MTNRPGVDQTVIRARMAELWQFPWAVMDVLIGGNSSIDLPRLRVRSIEEATEFLRAYGFDPEVPIQCRRIDAVMVEAMVFIERHLLQAQEWQNPQLRPPPEVLACDDARQLLIWASVAAGEEKPLPDRRRQAWACAILRVMHTIAHIGGTAGGIGATIDSSVAREEIFNRFRHYIHRESDGTLWLGEKDTRVELAKVEWKEQKTRHSIILKLLHKRDNVAEALYDYIGLRIVTKRLCDVMLVVKLLRQFNMVVYPNAYPSRARNTLVDLGKFRLEIRQLREKLVNNSISTEEFASALAKIEMSFEADSSSGGKTVKNPHSSKNFRSIQLTGRQLIRLRHPLCVWLSKLNVELASEGIPPAKAHALRELRDTLEGGAWLRHQYESEAFFPFEVQIMDAASYANVQSGDAEHIAYKTSQVRAARKRVLALVLELAQASPS